MHATIPRHYGQLFDDDPGPWWLPVTIVGKDGSTRESATIRCPNGHRYSQGLADHTIADDGRVHPSVLCDQPLKRDGVTQKCGWHVFATLEGWAERGRCTKCGRLFTGEEPHYANGLCYGCAPT